MNNTPSVSVIIPVYNSEKLLPRTLDSVCGQSLSNIEIICIDDGSSDESLRILNDYAANDSRVIVLSQPNSGAAVARNKGLSIAKVTISPFWMRMTFSIRPCLRLPTN